MQLKLGSEKSGFIYGGEIVKKLLKHLNPNLELVLQHCNGSDIIISSTDHSNHSSDTVNYSKKNYIYYSGEPYIQHFNKHHDKYIIIGTILDTRSNYIYIPYFLQSSHLYLKRKYTNNNRPFFLAYCNSNRIGERERLFRMFVEKSSGDICHSFGKCNGGKPETQKEKIGGGWAGDELIDKYKDYSFVIAMENCKKNGYVTEQIINAFYSGAIPIYWGSNNVNDFFNKKAFINVDDFESFEKCVEYVLNMTEKQKQAMMNEPIYNTENDIVNLFHHEYNKGGNSK